MRTLYFDCFAGVSGNMVLGALFGLGVSHDAIISEIGKLGIGHVEVDVTTVDRAGISATYVDVRPSEKEPGHRHLSEIVAIIEASTLKGTVKARSVEIFTGLAKAEARVHGIELDRVHFHEVGAVDAIVDVVGACIGFDFLGIERFICSKVNVGSGFITIDHGTFPVPPPAVAELLKGVPVYSNDIDGELTTPTGAAIISALCDSYVTFPDIKLERTAFGAGSRTYDRFPNVLRLVLGESGSAKRKGAKAEELILIETNLDDLSPQIAGYVMERAFELGARDCWFTPIQMKKNRPAIMISVLCTGELRTLLSDMLYSETTTLGLRVTPIERECVPREFVKVKTRFGDVDVKIAIREGRVMNAMPEYDQVRELARQNGVAFHEVHEAALAELRRTNSAKAAENRGN